MKKFALAVLIIGSFILFSLIYNHTNSAVLPPTTSTSADSSGRSSSASVTATTAGASGTPDTSSTPGAGATPGSAYKDGSYTGNVADAQWGNVQIQAVIQGGKITAVTFLQYPNDRNRSIEINNYADPQLVSEALQAQSANVDTVTGATDTSDAFIQSLTNALSQAQA